MKRIVVEIGEDLKRDFRLECEKAMASQKLIIIQLVSQWVKSRKRKSK